MAEIHVFSGLGSGVVERYREGMETLAKRIDGSFYASLSGYADWQEVADGIIQRRGSPVVLVGHSNGVYAILKVAEKLNANGVKVDYLASVDCTLKPCPMASGNIKLLHDFWAGLRKVHRGGSFTGAYEFFDLDDIEGRNVMHVEAASLPFVQNTIAATVAKLKPSTPKEPIMTGSTFDHWTPIFMRMLMEDFNLTVEDAAAVFGNAGHESAGYDTLQEKNPVVPGSRGGWGIMQWTGPRRKSFEAYCDRNGYDLADMMANYKWLFVELKGPEGAVLPKLRAAKTLQDKTKVFSNSFLRPGIPHMDSRYRWAERAIRTWNERKPDQAPTVPETPKPPVVAPVGDLDAFLQGRYPETEPEARQRAAMLADAIAYRLSPNPPSAGFSLPTSQGNSEMKSFLQSKTIWGVATMVIANVLPTVLPVLGYEFTSADAQSLLRAVQTMVEAAGAILAIYGRVVAKDALTFIKA